MTSKRALLTVALLAALLPSAAGAAKKRPVHARPAKPTAPKPAAPQAPASTPLALGNSGFENDEADVSKNWQPYERGFVVDTQIKHGGAQSLRCASDNPAYTLGASYTCVLDQKAPAPVQVGGWSRAQDVSGTSDPDDAVYVDVLYADGTCLYGQNAPFATGTHEWQQAQVLITPAKPIRSITVYALFRHHTGTVWFDDFAAESLRAEGLFDGLPLAPPRLARGENSGWFVRDAAANGAFVPSAQGPGLRLREGPAPANGQVTGAVVENLTRRTRAVTVLYAERWDAPRALWWDDIRTARPITPAGGEYINLTAVDVGAGRLSLYPWGCVSGQGKARALGLPPTQGPRIARIGYHPGSHLFYVAFDLALMPRGDKHSQAPVSVARYDVDPQWGFRDAARTFYALYPDSFARRAHKDGIWIPFTDPTKVRAPEDFAVAYHEGDNSLATDHARGILGFRYVEPMTYWMPMPSGVPRTYAQALAQVQTQVAGLAGKYEDARRASQAVLLSGAQDAGGQFNVQFRSEPWCDGAVWVLNPNPALPRPPDGWTKARLNQTPPITGTGLSRGDTPDGLYLDSVESWADVLDFRPASLRASSVPPTWTAGDFRAVVPTWFSVYDFARSASQDLHRRGKLLMGNTTPWRFHVFTPLLDVIGTEVNWLPGGAWQPDSDAVFCLRRTLAYHKPYLLLQNTDFSRFGPALVEKYFQRCLFYGVFPSFFSSDAATNVYWNDARLYERDRPLFRKYLPTLRRLSAAGWEPVTEARADRPDVWVERFGHEYLSVLNTSPAPINATVTVDLTHLYLGTSSLTVTDAVSGRALASSTPRPHTLVVGVALQPGETRVLWLHRAST